MSQTIPQVVGTGSEKGKMTRKPVKVALCFIKVFGEERPTLGQKETSGKLSHFGNLHYFIHDRVL